MKLNQLLINFDKSHNHLMSLDKQHNHVNFKSNSDTFEKNSEIQDLDEAAQEKDVPVACGVIFDRRRHKTEDVIVLRCNTSKNETTYRFMSKSLRKEYGYVEFTLCKNPDELAPVYLGGERLLKNYPEYGIEGPRVIVEWLENHNDSRYSGMGKLADKIAVKHCLDNNIKPVIISEADWGSHVAHYKRGKRFLPLTQDMPMYSFLKERYGTSDVNEILRQLVAKSEMTGEYVNIMKWQPITMYMPQELAQKYANELKSENKK